MPMDGREATRSQGASEPGGYALPAPARSPDAPWHPAARGAAVPASQHGWRTATIALCAMLVAAGGTYLFVDSRQPEPTQALVASTPAPTPSATPTSPAASAQPAPSGTSPSASASPPRTDEPAASPTRAQGSGLGTGAPVRPTVVVPEPPDTGEVYTPFYAVVLTSKEAASGGLAAAQALAPVVESAGYRSLVFDSSDFTSLRPGYAVLAAGPYSDRATAKAQISALRGLSDEFQNAYDRCVGTAGDCPSQ